jgi:hypothetical protein
VKKLISLSIIAILLLTACGGAEPDTSATGTEAETVAQATTATESEEAQAETAEEAPTATATEPPAVEEAPEATPTEAEVAEAEQPADTSGGEAVCRIEPLGIAPIPGIAPVSEADWQHGAEQAEVVIVEYGDFQ